MLSSLTASHVTRRTTRQPRRRAPASSPAPSVTRAELWLPTRLDACLPLADALWLRQAFGDDREALEAFASTALVLAIAEARQAGRVGGSGKGVAGC